MPMRVGAYIDGFNLYYAGRDHFRPPAPSASWKWLDLRALAASLTGWQGSRLDRVVYCTALRDRGGGPSSPIDQRTYLGALEMHGSVDLVEYGVYVSRVKNGVLLDRTVRPPAVVPPPAPAGFPARTVRLASGGDGLLVSVLAFEEKGSDVNLGTHLLYDVLGGRVDAAIVVSNDSDLALPIRLARDLVPVGTVNPGLRPLAGRLGGSPGDGVSRHWWRRLGRDDFVRHQLPEVVGPHRRPPGW